MEPVAEGVLVVIVEETPIAVEGDHASVEEEDLQAEGEVVETGKDQGLLMRTKDENQDVRKARKSKDAEIAQAAQRMSKNPNVRKQEKTRKNQKERSRNQN